ncbi:MAG: hypothetical protein EA344_10025 [Alkalicoccus sp.]|nr:MAG: hypothetical protein EA344_10025 [Alkalicoccus sp.]
MKIGRGCFFCAVWGEIVWRVLTAGGADAEYCQLFTGQTLFGELSQKKPVSAFCVELEKGKRLSILPAFPGILPTFFGIVPNGVWNSSNFRFFSTSCPEYYQSPPYFYQLSEEYCQFFTGQALFDDLSQKKNASAFCFDP